MQLVFRREICWPDGRVEVEGVMPKALPAPGDASHVLPSPRDPIADHGYATPMLRLLSRLLRALFQFSKRTAGKATKFGGSGVKLLGVVGAARIECGEPAAESGELIRRQLGNSFSDFDVRFRG